MSLKTFVTGVPDRSGSFLTASRVIAKYNGNIERVSYNKAVDPHFVFIDVSADDQNLIRIEKDLSDIGFLNKKISETRIIEVSVKIPDHPGAVLPVLEILSGHDINISYMNSIADGNDYQSFKFGLLIENSGIIKIVLDDISKIYPVDIIECDSSEEYLDNTVFYIRLASEMRDLLGLCEEKSIQFISESNRILQILQSEGENAAKIFGYIRRFAYFVSKYRGDRYKTGIQSIQTGDTVIYSIQPFCGSNTYLLLSGNEMIIMDTGYAIYAKEHMCVIKKLTEGREIRKVRIYITHSDVDHCGLLSVLNEAEIIVNQKSAENFQRQYDGLPDYREQTALHRGYSRISRIISGYTVPDIRKLKILDTDTPLEHESLIPIGNMKIGSLDFTVMEGSGGHLYGEIIYVCHEPGIIFTGDNLMNINGFSTERAEFNSLAPYLMKSVNVDSSKATAVRRRITALIKEISDRNNRPCIVCGGHGPVSEMLDGKLILTAKADDVSGDFK